MSMNTGRNAYAAWEARGHEAILIEWGGLQTTVDTLLFEIHDREATADAFPSSVAWDEIDHMLDVALLLASRPASLVAFRDDVCTVLHSDEHTARQHASDGIVL